MLLALKEASLLLSKFYIKLGEFCSILYQYKQNILVT